MSRPATPELAILLVADSYAMIRKVLRCYRAQTDPARLEIVVAAIRGAGFSAKSLHADGFAHATIVDAGDATPATAEARAVRAATAPYLVFAQAHAYPLPGFVEAILAACKGGEWSVVGPSIANANPESALSRAAMRIGYGPWCDRPVRGPAETVPGHNSAYERAALLALGQRLEQVLTAGARLQTELVAQGCTLFLEPAAEIEIVNVSRPEWFFVDLFCQGRRFAGERRLDWALRRRLAYAAAAPLIPIVRFLRISTERTSRRNSRERFVDSLALILGLATSAAGELVGYLRGRSSRPDYDETSLHRLRYVKEEERRRDSDESRWPGAPSLTR